jgi:integrase
VPLNNTAVKVIQKYIGEHETMVFAVNGIHYKRDHLFKWHQVNDRIGINEDLRKAGLLRPDEKFVFHGLRHTFATWLARTGVPVEIIEHIGGWSSGGRSRVVSNYTHVADVTHLLPYSKRIDEILSPKTSKKFSTNLAHNQWTDLAQVAE